MNKNKTKTKYIIKNFQLALAVTCAFHLTMNAGVCGHFELDDINRETYKTHYNNLPSVEESDANLKASPQFDSFLKEAEEIVTRYELEATIGLRLIHRHFTVGENQVMAEGYGTIDEVPSLVTYAHNFEEAKEKGTVPASWIFSDNTKDGIIPFEASDDPIVRVANTQLHQVPEFMNEMASLLKTSGLNHLLSIAVLQRRFLQPNEDEVFQELNFADPNRSIVQLRSAKDQPIYAIKTSWIFGKQNCYCCLPQYICWPQDDGKHPSVFVHNKDSK